MSTLEEALAFEESERKRLLPLRDAALGAPTGVFQRLAWKGPPQYKFELVMPSTDRPIPELISAAISSVKCGDRAGLELIHAFSVGPDRPSQVWLARVISPTPDGPLVVVKFFQESLARLPSITKQGQFIPMKHVIDAEFLAYCNIRDIQGSYVPYSFGFYTFRMPCGEDVVGHVMEHIDGVTMERFIQDQGPAALTLEDSLEQAFVGTLRAIRAVNMKDVAHQDIRLANIMIPKHGIPAAVLIDFSFSRIEEGTFHKTLGGRRDRGTFLNLMFSSERTKSFAEQWCMGNRNDPLLDGMFIPEEGFDKYQRRIEEADEAKKAGKRNLLD